MLLEERRSILKGKTTLEELAQWLSGPVSALVVNKTELTEIYDYAFPIIAGSTYHPPDAQGRMSPPTPAERAAEVSALMEEHLGLRLQAEKAIATEMIVLDHVEQPSEN